MLIGLKPGILDAQGTSIMRALSGLGFDEVRDVRVGKVLEIDLDGIEQAAARGRLDEMCRRLLVNPVIEEFRVELLSE